MGHHHGHHHHHHHDPDAPTSRILFAFLLNLGFAVIEIIGGTIIGSMSIIADAVHDLGDSFSLGLALILQKKSGASANAKYTYGFKRLSALSAVINACILIIGSLLVIANSIPLFWQTTEAPNGYAMMGFAVLGISVNGFAAWRLSQGSSQNEKMLTWHLIEDILGWVAVFIGAVLIKLFAWTWVDPLLACAIATFILYNVVKGLSSNLRIFLQYVPENIDLEQLHQKIIKDPGVSELMDFHAWTLDGEEHVCSCILRLQSTDTTEQYRVKNRLRKTLKDSGFTHITLELALAGDENCH